MNSPAGQAEMSADNAVAFYGTLRPGEASHWLVRHIPGRWIDGVIRGYRFDITWGRYEGYPGFVADSDGHRVPVSVLISDTWSLHLPRIDEYEGPGYERRSIPVIDLDGHRVLGEATVYVFLTGGD